MPSDTASASSRLTIPISPIFSTDAASSSRSDATSDEEPDLGAFATVLWAWNNLQPTQRMPMPHFPTGQSTFTPTFNDNSSISSFTHPGFSEASGMQSPEPDAQADTVWAQHPIQSYFSLNSITPSSERPQELEDDEYDIDIDNRGAEAGYGESPPPPSPLESEGNRTVEIYEGGSDLDQGQDSELDQLPSRGPLVMPMAVRGYPPRSFSQPTPSLRSRNAATYADLQAQITPRRSEFPIHDGSSVYSESQATSRTAGLRRQQMSWSPSHAVGYGSPRHVPVDDLSSVQSSGYHTQSDDPESAVLSLLSKARATRSLINDNSTVAHSPVDTHSFSPSLNSPPIHSPQPFSPSLNSPRLPPSSPRFQDSGRPTRSFHSPRASLSSPSAHSEGSKKFPYSPTQRSLVIDGSIDEEDESRTPTRTAVWGPGSQHQLPPTAEGYLRQPIAVHPYGPYSHPLKGHQSLPASAFNQSHRIDPAHGQHSSSSTVIGQEDQPSLGLLDEALGFIAAERAKREAIRGNSHHHSDNTIPRFPTSGMATVF
ncbi:hypothetical protein DFP72DRAFT_903787 [Ephemerocybe angulata]|uniref:Uncharacterized protein n=1 Tax=Ephemerocybe angulata TaxID=980116 RepID=A0A8H6HTE1_9AGAR|nr:hypothetical protein DFP72DRAFT_903787 [Tulosesus angulatus]